MENKGRLFEPLTLLEDEPVPSHNVDELGLIPFAKVIAGAAIGTGGPFTVGVFGGWGTGKSSVLKQAKSLIDCQDPDAITVWFNAWKYEREPQPLIPLIAGIIAAIEGKQTTGAAISKKAKDSLKNFGNTLRALAYGLSTDVKINFPWLAEFGLKANSKDMIQRIDQLEEGQRDALFQKTLFINILEQLDELAANVQTVEMRPKIVVFVDDLDRCLPDNGLRLLEKIKLVLAKRGFVFVLAVDRQKIESYIHKRYQEEFGIDDYRRSGTSYFDKIVQLPLPLPPHELRFESYIRNLIGRSAISNKPEIKGVFESLVDLLNLGAAANPRSLVRLINNLLVDWRLWQLLEQDAEPEILRMSAVSRIVRQYMDEEHFYKLVRDNKLCETIADIGGSDRLRMQLGKAQREELNSIEQNRLSVLGQLENNEILKPLFSHEVAVYWLTHHELRRKIENFLITQREASVGATLSQSEIVDEAIRKSLGAQYNKHEFDANRSMVKSLYFNATGLNDTGMTLLEGVGNLQTLGLTATRVTDAGLAHLEGLRGLKWLELTGTQITDAGLAHLEGMSGLTHIDLKGTKVTDAGLAHLEGMTGLEGLVLTDTQVTDAGLAHLAGLKGLRRLILSNQITDAGLVHLGGLSGLWELVLSGTNVTDAGLVHLEGLSELRDLVLNDTQVTDAGLAHLKDFFGLKRLVLSGTQITDAGLAHLGGMSGLEGLVLNDTQVTDAGLAHIRGLRGLESLDLNSTQITDAGLAHIRGLRGLWRLVLLDTQVTDAGLAHLEDMRSMHTLGLGGTRVTDAGLSHLAGLSKLQRLALTGTQVSGAGLSHLEGLDKLWELILDRTQVTEAVKRRLMKNYRISLD